MSDSLESYPRRGRSGTFLILTSTAIAILLILSCLLHFHVPYWASSLVALVLGPVLGTLAGYLIAKLCRWNSLMFNSDDMITFLIMAIFSLVVLEPLVSRLYNQPH